MKFTVHCFDVPVIKSAKKHRKVDDVAFWKIAEQKEPGIKGAKGAYIFALRRSKGYIPFYVGKTNNSFGQETLQSHKLLHYSNCINDECGSPVIVFIAARTETGRFSVNNNDKLFQWLETYLINLALTRNSELLNTAKTKFIREIKIPDLLNSEKGISTKESRILKQMLAVK